MITIVTCSNDAEASMLQSLLEANGIPAFLPDALTAQTAVHFAGSGCRIQVPEDRVDEARRILADAEAEAADDEDPEAAD